MARRTAMTPALALALATTLALTPSVATADPSPADSSASVGGGMALFGIDAVDLGPLAPCAAGGPFTAATDGATSDPAAVSYGAGTTSCALDQDTGVATATASGRAFRLDALRPYGGPTIRIGTFSATCTTTPKGTKSSVSLGGVIGIDLPSTVPTNHSVTIPGATATDPPLAIVTLNSVVTPEPGDGSATVSAAKIRFFPNGGPGSGTLTVGTVTCTPPVAG